MIVLNLLNPDIAFDGWAISLIVFILTLVIPGIYVYATKSKVKQKQRARNRAVQKQRVRPNTIKDENIIKQKQVAKDYAEQNQSV